MNNKGYVLTKIDYKENDVIVKMLCENNKVISFIARGVKKITSKNKYALNVLNFIEVDLIKKGEVYILKTAKLLVDNNELSTNILISTPYLYCATLIASDDTLKNNYYQYFNNMFFNSEELYSDMLKIILSLYANQGGLPQSGKCVSCSSTSNIAHFSIREGGFVCSDCTKLKYKKNTLINIYNFIQNKEFSSVFEINDALIILRELIENVELKLGYKPKSTKFLIDNLPKI